MKEHSQTELENYIIAAVFAGDEHFDTFNQCSETGINADSFTNQQNAEIWEAMMILKARDELLEEANILVQLSKNPENRITFDSLIEYIGLSISPSQAPKLATELHRKEILRKLKRELRLGIESIEDNEDPEKIVAGLQRGFDNLESVGDSELNMEEIAKLVYGNLLDPNAPDKEYFPTGLTHYDATLKGHGFGAGQLCVWAARPGLGKTTVVLNAAMHNVKMGNPVGFISLEMDEEELGEKVAALECQLPLNIFEDKVASAEQMSKMHKALKKISKLPLHIDNRSRSLTQIIIKCKQWVKKKGVKLVIIDYCQLIRGDKSLPREQQISEISRELKLLASDLKIPVLLVAQLNRESEKVDRRPIMSDLRESGALEQDANSITFLYLKGEDRVNGDPNFVRWYRAKQRGGQTDEGVFGFKRNIGQFSSVNDNPDMMP